MQYLATLLWAESIVLLSIQTYTHCPLLLTQLVSVIPHINAWIRILCTMVIPLYKCHSVWFKDLLNKCGLVTYNTYIQQSILYHNRIYTRCRDWYLKHRMLLQWKSIHHHTENREVIVASLKGLLLTSCLNSIADSFSCVLQGNGQWKGNSLILV